MSFNPHASLPQLHIAKLLRFFSFEFDSKGPFLMVAIILYSPSTSSFYRLPSTPLDFPFLSKLEWCTLAFSWNKDCSSFHPHISWSMFLSTTFKSKVFVPLSFSQEVNIFSNIQINYNNKWQILSLFYFSHFILIFTKFSFFLFCLSLIMIFIYLCCKPNLFFPFYEWIYEQNDH